MTQLAHNELSILILWSGDGHDLITATEIGF